jgi:hypothetical protein
VQLHLPRLRRVVAVVRRPSKLRRLLLLSPLTQAEKHVAVARLMSRRRLLSRKSFRFPT